MLSGGNRDHPNEAFSYLEVTMILSHSCRPVNRCPSGKNLNWPTSPTVGGVKVEIRVLEAYEFVKEILVSRVSSPPPIEPRTSLTHESSSPTTPCSAP